MKMYLLKAVNNDYAPFSYLPYLGAHFFKKRDAEKVLKELKSTATETQFEIVRDDLEYEDPNAYLPENLIRILTDYIDYLNRKS